MATLPVPAQQYGVLNEASAPQQHQSQTSDTSSLFARGPQRHMDKLRGVAPAARVTVRESLLVLAKELV